MIKRSVCYLECKQSCWVQVNLNRICKLLNCIIHEHDAHPKFSNEGHVPYSRVIRHHSFISAASLLGTALLLDPGNSLLGILQLVQLNEQKLVKVVIPINNT